MSLRKYRDEIKGIRERMQSQVGDLSYKRDHDIGDASEEYYKEDMAITQLNKAAQKLNDAEDELRPRE